jgi:hypothetical protein
MTRAARYAEEFEATHTEFTRLIESLDAEQWRQIGKNHPQRMNDEDEGRTVGVIAHHVAVNSPWVMERIQATLDGRPLQPVDMRAINAQHAGEHAEVTREEVLRLLRQTQAEIAAAIRAIPDDQLDQARETPVGPMSVAQRIERVLIGHIKAHQGSIEAAIA